MFETFYMFAWVGYIGAAAALAISRRGNAMLVLGLAGLAINSMRFALVRSEFLSAQDVAPFSEALQWVSMGAIALVVLGVLQLALGRSAAGSAAPESSAENVASLIIPRTESNSYSNAVKLRDAACDLVVAQAQAGQLAFILHKSNPNAPEVWFRLDFLQPQSDPRLSLRAFLAVTVERRDFHRFENLLTVETRVGAQTSKVDGVIAIDADAVKRIYRHLTEPGVRLVLPQRVRQFGWQLWRPINKIERLRPDWAMTAAVVGAVALAVVPGVGPLLLVAAFIAIYFWSRRRRTFVLTSGRPLGEPRRLHWMDSWQVTVGGLAEAGVATAQKVRARVLAGAPEGLSLGIERIAYWGVDGQVQREQIAVHYRRSMGFIHVVPYGENLYVGWECHLNTAAWTEEAAVRGVDRSTGLLVHANRVVAGTHALNEYDVADANFLSEWLHEAVKRELLLQIAEHQINQEIDFTVQRESRKDALQAGGSVTEAAKPRRRLTRTA